MKDRAFAPVVEIATLDATEQTAVEQASAQA
jgi:hypothetical protein